MDQRATTELAARLAVVLRKGDLLALHGDLGAGKTAFARSLIEAIAGGAIEVVSPTYTLMQIYELPRCPVVHADLYRLGHPDELDEIGLSELLAGHLALVEWPERAGARLSRERIDLVIDGPFADAHDELRRVTMMFPAAQASRFHRA